MAQTKKRCKGKTKAGKPCRAIPGPSGWCTFHSPARAEAQREAHKKGGQQTPAKIITLDETVKINLGVEADNLIDKLIAEVGETTPTRGGAFNLKKARTIGYLVGIKLRALEATDIEERLQVLEKRTK